MPAVSRRRLAALLAFSCSWSSCVPLARAMTPEEEKAVERGMDALFRSDYDGAESLFKDALAQQPGHAVYSLGYATSVWWRMENSFALPGSPEEKAFQAAIEAAIRDARRARDETKQPEAYLYLGTAYGLRGRWRASKKSWLTAYIDGRRAYRNASKAVALDPALFDAYLGIGAFDYYVATLSGIVRALAFTGGGDKAQGLAKLRLAAERGRFSRVAAKLLLVGILWTLEKKPQEAWSILEELHARYPDSPMIDSMRLLGLYHLRDAAGLKTEAKEYLEKARRGAPFFQAIDLTVGRCFLGLSAQLSGNPAEALEDYAAALNELQPNHRWRSVLRLFMGEALDLSGRREDAMEAYRSALKEAPLWGVHRYARHLLKHPFRHGDDPLPPRKSGL